MVERRVVRAGDLIGRLEGEAIHPPNQADESWAERERLLEEARQLGLEIHERWPLVILREEVAQARAKR